MKLSISNIAWEAEKDEQLYNMLKLYGYKGLEIAPTRIFPEKPYDKLLDAEKWKKKLTEKYGLSVSSMQSIWFGRQEKLFGTQQDREILVQYTKKAIDFASVIGCKNVVFGCPRNREVPKGMDAQSANPFFKEIGDYAFAKGTVIGMEANPPIYNTNYINDTSSALKLIQAVDSKGFKLNLDVGTMIINQEKVDILKDKVELINHVHISEPGLKTIKVNQLHVELYKVLKQEGYSGFISIEMGKVEATEEIERVLCYVKSIFNE